MFGRISSMARGSGGGTPSFALVPPQALAGLFGPPAGASRPLDNKIVQDLWVQPYRGPLDLDRYGNETADQRRAYRDQYRSNPVLRAALRGKADAISCLEVTVLPSDKDNKKSCEAAEFVDWAVSQSPRGWRGVIDSIYSAAAIDGYSVCEKKLEEGSWKGRSCWKLAHVRQLDTNYIRLQLDQYRNVLAVVNIVQGLEYFEPDDVIVHTHNGMYGNPFGQSDARAATRACNIIEDVYKVWYLALKVYGLPYIHGKYDAGTQKAALKAALQSLREGGYAVTSTKDSIEVLNLAAGAAINGFESMVQTQREDIFFAVRGASLPFLEGDGGQNAHGDAGVQKAASDSNEYASALDVTDTINRQLIPWLCRFNYGEIDYPRVKLGGTNWDETAKLTGVIRDAQAVGLEVSAEWAHKVLSVPPPRDPSDKLVSAEEKQQQQQQPGAPGAGGAPPSPSGGEPPPPSPDGGAPGSDPVEDDATAAALEALGGANMSAKAESRKPGEVYWVPTAHLKSDPARLQFRRGHDGEDGTVRDLPAEKFDAAKCDPLLAWHDPGDGEDYVVDGHHRKAWAERDGAPNVPVKFIDARTADEAKEIGRRANERARTFSEGAPAPDQFARVVDALLSEVLA